MTDPLGVSIVIANHNYERYLSEAIDSALGQTHPLVEVVVVDDGSTDGSAALIEAYGDQVTAVFQANAGQTRACEAGFARSRHPVVVFLDADDRLVPEAAAMAARTLAAAPNSNRVSKLQFRLQILDEAGTPRDHLYPKYPADLTPEAIRAELLRTGYYPSPPTSGNAYTRHFLDVVSPFAEHPHIDALLNTLAPLYGDVLASPEVVGHYRVHPESNSYAGCCAVARLRKLIALDPLRLDILARHCAARGQPFAGFAAIRNLLPYRELEVVIAKLDASGWRDNLRVLGLLAATLRAGMGAPYSRWHRLLRALWITALALTPRALAGRLAGLRYDPTRRPAFVEAVADALPIDRCVLAPAGSEPASPVAPPSLATPHRSGGLQL